MGIVCCGNNSSEKYDSSLKQMPVDPKEVLYKTDYKMNDDAVYSGQMKPVKVNGKDDFVKHGKGKQKWPDGAFFDGEWRNDKASGLGHYQHANKDVYIGEFTEDKANGYGTYTHASGQSYEGKWKNDLQDGDGIEVLEDGSKYVGKFNMGKKDGFGT